MPLGDFINSFPPAVFLAVHLAGFLIGAGLAYRSFNSGSSLFGWGFVLYALAELVYMTYHLDWTVFLFGKPQAEVQVWAGHCFENRAFDHFRFGFDGRPALDFEVTLLSWRNSFRADVIGERGSAHIDSLCKWGPSTFTLRRRVLPSGRPDEESHTLVCADPTWQREYEHFKQLCRRPATNIDTDVWIGSVLDAAAAKARVGASAR